MKRSFSASLLLTYATYGSAMILNPKGSIRKSNQRLLEQQIHWIPLSPLTLYGLCITTPFLMAPDPASANDLSWPAIEYSSAMNHSGFLSTFSDTILASRDQLLAAGIARGVSISACFPLDTIKTRIQIGNPNETAWSFAGLFKGIGGSLVGQIPYGILTFGSYEVYKRTLIDNFPNANVILIYVLAAIMGDITGSGWLCPSEVVKQQVQANMYINTMSAIRGIWKKKRFPGFYQGYASAIIRDVPFRAIQLTTFELTKTIYLSYSVKEMTTMNLDPLEAAICGAVAGSVAAAITNPLDRTKSLIMTDEDGEYGSDVIKCLGKMYHEDGIAGLFTGIIPRVGYITPSTTVFFIVYEEIQKILK